ncbi:MAG: helix-turn-helix domain-containing protein, partial [Candidatus Pacebacteria bacterium]|nr:helix-turn-helix domain-containing protein [Candidatus Paceibacterota bacterium]
MSETRKSDSVWLTSRDAAEQFGYTSDYVSLLCRTGKVTAERSGKVWMVERASIADFSARAAQLDAERRARLSEIRKVEYHKSVDVPVGAVVGVSPYVAKTYAGAVIKVGGALLGITVFLFGFALGAYALPSEWGKPQYTVAVREFVHSFPRNADTQLAGIFVAVSDAVTGEVRTSTDPYTHATWGDVWDSFATALFGNTEQALPLVGVAQPPQPAMTTQRATTTPGVQPARAPAERQTPAVTQTIVRNVTEYVTVSGITRAELDAALAAQEARLRALIPQTVPFTGQPPQSVVTTYSFAQSQRIDQLDGVVIRNATIVGGTISGVSGLGSGSGTVSAGAQGQVAYFQTAGATVTATSTLFFSDTQRVGIATSSPLAQLTVYGGLLLSGANRYFNFGDAEGVLGYGIRDNAGFLEFKNSGGAWVPLGSGGSGGGSWATTTSSVAGVLVNYPLNTSDVVAIGSNSTTSAEYWFDPNVGIATLTGRVFITNASTTFLTSAYASTSNQVISNTLSIGALNGILRATAGVVGTSLVNLASDVTGTLGATNGGTGLATIASSSLLIGGPGNTWIQFATSSLGIALSDT